MVTWAIFLLHWEFPYQVRSSLIILPFFLKNLCETDRRRCYRMTCPQYLAVTIYNSDVKNNGAGLLHLPSTGRLACMSAQATKCTMAATHICLSRVLVTSVILQILPVILKIIKLSAAQLPSPFLTPPSSLSLLLYSFLPFHHDIYLVFHTLNTTLKTSIY